MPADQGWGKGDSPAALSDTTVEDLFVVEGDSLLAIESQLPQLNAALATAFEGIGLTLDGLGTSMRAATRGGFAGMEFVLKFREISSIEWAGFLQAGGRLRLTRATTDVALTFSYGDSLFGPDGSVGPNLEHFVRTGDELVILSHWTQAGPSRVEACYYEGGQAVTFPSGTDPEQVLARSRVVFQLAGGTFTSTSYVDAPEAVQRVLDRVAVVVPSPDQALEPLPPTPSMPAPSIPPMPAP